MISSYQINGIDLDVNSFGWILLASSKPRAGISNRVLDLVPAGFDGNFVVPSTEDSPLLVLSVRVPDTQNEPFLALMDSNVLTLTHDSYTATVELLSAAVAQHGMDFTDYDCTLRFPGMFWREAVTTPAAVALTTSPQTVPYLAGLSAPVRDAIVRVAGGFSSITVADTQGTFFTYLTAVAAGSYLRFESGTGRAYVTSTNVWTGGTEVTGAIVNGPSAYPLSITPVFTDPGTRAAALTVTTAGRTGSPTIEVRAARAFRI